jgi:SAM-dependent methyltransferase
LNVEYETLLKNHEALDSITFLYDKLKVQNYGRLWFNPSFQSPDFYKKALKYEDVYYRFWDCKDGQFLKEAGSYRTLFPQNKEKLFNALAMGDKVNSDFFMSMFDDVLVTVLEKYGLIAFESSDILFNIRIIPTPLGPIISDPRSSQDLYAIHFGLDSVLFFNFLKRVFTERTRIESILELGCGTGIHSILAEKTCGVSKALLTDINKRALECAQLNCILNGCINDRTFCKSNWFENIEEGAAFDIILCNPPFEWRTGSEIDSSTLAGLGGGQFGLLHTLHVLKNLQPYINQNSVAYLLTQSVVDMNGNIKLFDIDGELLDILKEYSFAVKTHVLYEHMLVTENMMKDLIDNNLSHFALTVIEISIAPKYSSKTVDARPFIKRLSDKKRVKTCYEFWQKYFNGKKLR